MLLWTPNNRLSSQVMLTGDSTHRPPLGPWRNLGISPQWRTKGEYASLFLVDEGRKRVIGHRLRRWGPRDQDL